MVWWRNFGWWAHAQCYGHNEQPFLRGGVLRAFVDLFPHRKVVVYAPVEVRVEGDSRDIMEHQIG